MKTGLRPAFYALPSGVWRDYVTLLHFPYTVWHLGYVVFGALAAPGLHYQRLAGAVLAFFLAVGLSAHALDEYRDRPLRTRIPDGQLLTIAALSLTGALAIGSLAAATISLWAILFVLFGGFIVLAYNLEMFQGRFHSDLWFGLGWGAFPALVGYWASAERLDAQAFLVAAGCFALSLAQRTLSSHARRLRRRARSVCGQIEFQDGRVEPVTLPYLLAAPEQALRMVGLSVPLLALGWMVARL